MANRVFCFDELAHNAIKHVSPASPVASWPPPWLAAERSDPAANPEPSAPPEPSPAIPEPLEPPAPAIDATGPRCDKCGCRDFIDTPIHGGQSVRRDCRHCHRTMGFPLWHGRLATITKPGRMTWIEPKGN